MVVLRIVLEDFRLLLVVEVPYEIVDAELLPPFFAIDEPRKASLYENTFQQRRVTYISLAKLTLNFLARKKRS